MKKIAIFTTFVLAVSIALNVEAASVTFEPQNVALRVAPGKTGRTYIVAHGYSNQAYSLNFFVGTKLAKSNIPPGWLTAAYMWLDSEKAGKSSNTMNLIVNVPQDAKPGTYSALLEPVASRTTEAIVSPGVTVTIEVPGPKTLVSDSSSSVYSTPRRNY